MEDTTTMPMKRDALILMGICGLMVLLSLGGLVWAFVAAIAFTMDGLLLILTCLAMGGLFTLMLAWMAKEYGWIRLPRKKDGNKPEAEK